MIRIILTLLNLVFVLSFILSAGVSCDEAEDVEMYDLSNFEENMTYIRVYKTSGSKSYLAGVDSITHAPDGEIISAYGCEYGLRRPFEGTLSDFCHTFNKYGSSTLLEEQESTFFKRVEEDPLGEYGQGDIGIFNMEYTITYVGVGTTEPFKSKEKFIILEFFEDGSMVILRKIPEEWKKELKIKPEDIERFAVSPGLYEKYEDIIKEGYIGLMVLSPKDRSHIDLIIMSN